jgi:hypothetical protein
VRSGNAQSGTAKWWDGATCQACAPLSYRDVINSAKGSDVESADNRAKWFRAFIRQIFFRKKCARMDSRSRSSDGTAQYRLELSQYLTPGFPTLVTKLDAIEGGQLLRTCRKRLRP